MFLTYPSDNKSFVGSLQSLTVKRRGRFALGLGFANDQFATSQVPPLTAKWVIVKVTHKNFHLDSPRLMI